MTPFRYILQPYARNARFTCPQCNHNRKTFTRYIDTETQTHIADHVGKCDRSDKCGYHYPPMAYFKDNKGSTAYIPKQVSEKPFDTLPRRYVDEAAKAYHYNNFITFLTRCFDEATALRLATKYKIGTSKHWPGATIFWQIDVNDNVRTGKIMLYNPADGQRVKQPFNHISWAHVVCGRVSVAGGLGFVSSGQRSESWPQNTRPEIQKPEDRAHTTQPGPRTTDYRLQQCFFGEHLLSTDPFKIVAIAESEKTAVVCSFYYPEYIWLAAGSLDGLSLSKCKVLKDRRVILYPDLNGFDKWQLKTRELNLRMPTSHFSVDDTLERIALPEERAKGLDMADRWLDQLSKLK
jgi:hypothetical protein